MQAKNSLKSYLDELVEFYEKFDLFKAHRFKQRLKLDFHQKTIQILGTNGKGSTGRYLALMLSNSNHRVGHFISPHIFSYEERFSIYENATPLKCELESAHETLQELIIQNPSSENLSYFEYFCFLAVLVFKDCDYVILEAGLGGEYDATSIFKRDLCVFTPISIDHTDILGASLEQIIRTKIKAMCEQNIFADDFEIIKKAALQKGVQAQFLRQDYSRLCLDKSEFLRHNFSLAQLAYFAIKEHFYIGAPVKLDLRARCEKIASNILIDVGHNAAAARNLKTEIERHFSGKISLITNFFANKEVKTILKILSPCIDELLIYDYESPHRALADIASICAELGIKNKKFSRLEKSKNYAVFGSFMLIERFLNASKII